MRLTSPFNLPAPGRRQTLYVVFDLAEPCVFSKQSPEPLYCNSRALHRVNRLTRRSTPSSEVTGSICRVPKRGITLAPEDFLLAYLCRFAVRVPTPLLRGFSRQRGVTSFAGLAPFASTPQDSDPPDLPGRSPYGPQPTRPIVGLVVVTDRTSCSGLLDYQGSGAVPGNSSTL